MLFRRSTSLWTLWRRGLRAPARSPETFQGFIDDPNTVLRDAIADQDILGFIAINLTTDTLSANGLPTLGVGSLYETVSNIPFLGVANQTPPSPLPNQPATVATAANPVPNAFVYSASATFWIEWVRIPALTLRSRCNRPGAAGQADFGARAVLGAFDVTCNCSTPSS